MFIKTTLNLKLSQAVLLYNVAEEFNVSRSSILNSLARKIFKSHLFSPRFLETVHYQPVLLDENDCWKKVPVSFKLDVYEKCQDVRKIFKVSVSRALALGIIMYLKEIIKELKGKKESDNYTSNYIRFVTDCGYFKHITLLWDMVDPEILQEIYELHRKT